jgi:hypothetical protein
VSVEKLVAAKYAALGSTKFDLTVLDHGDPGTVYSESGGTIVANNVAAKLGNVVNGKVKRIRFYSCRTGLNAAQFLQNLRASSGATEVNAYESYVLVTKLWPHSWMAGKWGNKATCP